jgi:DNA modification methylase
MKTDRLDLRLMDNMELMREFPDKHFNLAVVDPPYGIGASAGTGKYGREKNEAADKKWDDEIPPQEYFNELFRVSKEQIIWGGNYFPLPTSRCFIIWDKGDGEPAMHKQVLNSSYEMVLILEDDAKCGRVIQNAKFKRGEMSNILRIRREKKTSKIHSAVFPEKLPIQLIQAFSEKGDIIYDPFIGTGTTALASIKLNRNWIGSEISHEYVDLANKRIKIYLQQQKLF